MDNINSTIDPKTLTHKEFADAFIKGQIDFKIVGFRFTKLIFGKEKIIQRIIHYLQYLPAIAIPIVSYVLANWWILFGLLIYVFVVGFAEKKLVPFGGLFSLYCIILWIAKGFSVYQLSTIFFFLIWFTYIIINLDRNIQRNYAKRTVINLDTAYNMLVEYDNIEIRRK